MPNSQKLNKYVGILAKVELARRNFFDYCNLRAPDFYKRNRKYLLEMCDSLQKFMTSPKKILVVDLPPRHGKSRTLQLFVEWALGHDIHLKIMTGSYNELLSTVFAKGVRDAIWAEHLDDERPVYGDVFPGVRIKPGDGSANRWSLEGGYNNYLATSPGGSATGFGANLLIIDDLIRNAEEAHNEIAKERMWTWFTQTMLSRLEEGGKIVIVMTRWASNDLAGRVIQHYGKEKILHINMKAVQPDGSMLCDEILSKESCEEKKKAMGLAIWSANYQQEPIDIKGRLYGRFKTYKGELPRFKTIRSYTDTADTGADYLCAYVYGVTFQNEAYILDTLFTDEPMEKTEPAMARMLLRNNVNVAVVESNNGGRGFARSVERILKQELGSNKTVIRWFTQTQNKQARILSNATWCMEHIYFPEGWSNRWPELYSNLYTYQRNGKNKHDDACFVAGTKVATIFGNKPIERIVEGDLVITPFGIRRVLAAGATGAKAVIRNIGLEGTPEHRVYCDIGEFRELQDINAKSSCNEFSFGGLIRWKYKELLYLTEKNTALWGKDGIISIGQVQIRGEKVPKDFMWRFGSFITDDEYLMAVTFTTRTVILLIMTLIIWSAYLLGNTFRSITKSESVQSGSVNGKPKAKKPLLLGIGARKAEIGILNTEKRHGKTTPCTVNNASNAAPNLKATLTEQDFARINAANAGAESIIALNTQPCVLSAAKNLREQNISPQLRNQKPAQSYAQIGLITSAEKVKVYNLTVERDHVYYANGILVSNCDALTGVCEDVLNGIVDWSALL
ncbi:MAG: phage terminase large subunit [Selenomonadaceae bacterium]|nr:phage terminase large subunit [Selenomonadaceae bacterium]